MGHFALALCLALVRGDEVIHLPYRQPPLIYAGMKPRRAPHWRGFVLWACFLTGPRKRPRGRNRGQFKVTTCPFNGGQATIYSIQGMAQRFSGPWWQLFVCLRASTGGRLLRRIHLGQGLALLKAAMRRPKGRLCPQVPPRTRYTEDGSSRSRKRRCEE
jgi:hypothetical protein